MSQYQLSIEPSLVAEAEQLVSLEGRGFPTLVVSWEAPMLGQEWQTLLVLKYAIPLPPLTAGRTFNEVRIAAFTGDVPTKYLYFGTELHAEAPRIAPEMENTISTAGHYQEYRLTEDRCAVPYLGLIQTTPRIYGNGPQDYYSPSIPVERFDAEFDPDLIVDKFPEIVAGLPPVGGRALTDPRGGLWRGSRFVGTSEIAVLHHGVVVGLLRRKGEREVVPPDVVRRDPHLDVREGWTAIDFGMSSTVVAQGNGDRHEFLRIGSQAEVTSPADFENPSEVAFGNLARTIKAWRDRVMLPLTHWGDVYVGHGARERLAVHGKERALRTKATIGGLGALPARLEQGDDVFFCGRNDLDGVARLQRPAPPLIDEEGIGSDDPFDPIELYAYYIGLHVNDPRRGICLRYALGMPAGWPETRRTQVLAQFRRGLLRSLPAGMVDFDDLNMLQVVDAGPNVRSFANYSFRVFGVVPKAAQPVPFVAIDAGASETGVLCGYYRVATSEERGAGFERILEHVEPVVLPQIGGELLLHRMAYQVYALSGASMRHNDVPFLLPAWEVPLPGAEDRLIAGIEAQANTRLLKEAIRPILETSGPSPVPDALQLFSRSGRLRDVRVMIDRAALLEWLQGQLSEAAVALKGAIVASMGDAGRGEIPWDELRVFVGGRLGMHPFLQERLEAVLPDGVRLHKYREPDTTNLATPTVKLATALGILGLRFQPVRPETMTDKRSGFNYRVGRTKRGKLLTVLDGDSGYDNWRELGACTRPEVTVLFVPEAEFRAEMMADDPAVRTVVCNLGYDAVGYRVYLRAISGREVEVSVGSPGGVPLPDAASWVVNLADCTGEPA